MAVKHTALSWLTQKLALLRRLEMEQTEFLLTVGDIVICTFGESPSTNGKYRDIRFELNSVGEDKELIEAAGGISAWSSFKAAITSTIIGAVTGVVGAITTGWSNYGPAGATLFAYGNTQVPNTLQWSGYHNVKNKKQENMKKQSSPVNQNAENI